MKRRRAPARLWVRLLLWISVVCWMGAIFAFSAQDGEQSEAVSTGVVEEILQIAGGEEYGSLSEEEQNVLQTIVRKCAHFSEYALLGCLAAAAVWAQGLAVQAQWGAWGLCTAYAAGDELHQCFVPGRAPGVMDVCIDAAGAALGVALALLSVYLWRKRRERR